MKNIEHKLNNTLGINFPIVMAPMFLVTNKAMLLEGMKAGIMATFPSLNFRNKGELDTLLDELNAAKPAEGMGNYGVNLIVQKSNIYLEEHLKICIEKKVPFYITSLGNPETVIKEAHAYGAKVFCDVTNLEHAKKCYDKGCDGFVAVGQGAGGHAGPNPLQVLVPALKKAFPDKFVLAAGGIATGEGLLSVRVLGADGAYIGTRFIASKEAGVSDAYKNAIIDSNMEDIVMTSKLSGTPATIINTPTAKKLGYDQNWFEKLMMKNPKLKKRFKMLIQWRGMKKLEQSILPNNYLQLWCAGKSVELIDDIKSVAAIVEGIKKEYFNSLEGLKHLS